MVQAATIGVIATKGGCGKSTVVSHCAGEAARQGFQVLVLDCDQGQHSLSIWGEAIRNAPNPVFRTATYETVAASIAQAEQEGFDLIFADTPASAPSHGQLVNRVASLADHILIPLRGTTFDLLALRNTIDLLATTVDGTKPEALQQRNCLMKAAIVLNGIPPRPADKLLDDIDGALEQCGAGDLEVIGVLRERTAYSRTLAKGLGVTEHRGDAEATAEIERLFKKIRARTRARQTAIEKLSNRAKQGVNK